MKKETIKVKVDQTKLPNRMHFEVQKKMRAHVYKPKKGKGSFKRRKTIDFDQTVDAIMVISVSSLFDEAKAIIETIENLLQLTIS